MRNKVYLPFLFIITFSFGQKKIDPTSEDVLKAKTLKTQYPDADVVLLESKDYVSFQIDKKNNKVLVNHKKDETLMNVAQRSEIQKHLFYDGQSEIKEFKISFRNKKQAYFHIKDEFYTSNDLFHNDTRVKYTHIGFPVLGYKYHFESLKHFKDIKYFTTIYFTEEYPSLEREITFVVPKWLKVTFKEMNFEGFDITKSEVFDKKQNTTIVTFKAMRLQAFFDEKESPGPSHIYPHILVRAQSFTQDDKTHMLFNETKDLYNWYKSLVDNIDNDPSTLKEKVAKLTANKKTDEDKIKSIYYWVQDNIRYIAFEDGIAGFKPDAVQNVFNKRYGDCKGMANLTKQMLIEAGFDARLTWIGTKRIAYDYSTPSLSVDNHMICTVFKDGNKIFLDGTEKYNAFGEYAERIQGKQVMIENGNSYFIETVPKLTHNSNKETFIFNAKINGDLIEGHVSRTYIGESRASFLNYYNNLKNDEKNEALKYYLNNDNRNLLVTSINTSDLEKRDNMLSIDYSLTQKNAVSSFGKEIYIDLDYHKSFGKFMFEERNTNYIFSYKRHLKSEVNLEIPEGYTIGTLPKGIDVDTKNYRVLITLKADGRVINYTKLFILKNAILETSDFEAWNKMIKSLQSIYQEQIILTKK
ncbi:transglutaminase-like domain-containing protein [Tamlana sp. 2201CG12-4]|uniref:transglutaminase-like domain-containing protein n=1 Tax=Tamlana sp. 2201CG12-4 TaxID=3112582 RepID=UPI002DC0128D|nr:transglutaminase-like domain-containing protein [Tamlana sp. 2201CG12-4]MEC3906105.1 transglutaminase-like domain-containing protein [Tamlana sp. 2201CG12-4]